MSNRERWIIYPLLFMALLFGLKQGLVPKPNSLEAPTLICKELRIVDSMDPSSQKVRVRLNQGPNGSGQVVLFNGDNERAVQLSTTNDAVGGAVVVFGENGQEVGALAAREEGGYLNINASDSDLTLRLEHVVLSDEQGEIEIPISGLLAYQNGNLVPIQGGIRLGAWGLHLPRELSLPDESQEPDESNGPPDPGANTDESEATEDPSEPLDISPSDLEAPEPDESDEASRDE